MFSQYAYRVLLIDADSKIPNLALMKLARHYENCEVDILRLGIPYYPNRKHKHHFIKTYSYDKVYCSVVFDGNSEYVHDLTTPSKIEFGGTGVSLSKTLPDDIERLNPSYDIYPENDTSYGFISRGCIRKCKFCYVPEKEGKIRQVANVDDIVKHKKVKFLDNNFLALPNHVDILNELIDKNIRHQFNQGLDIRLITSKNSELLSRLNYIGEYIFAFDDYSLKDVVDRKLSILKWRKDFGLKFFVYVHPDMEISETVNRIEFLKNRRCLPYIMRDKDCWWSEHEKFYTDISAWCNQPSIFKNMDFNEFLERRHIGRNSGSRIMKSLKTYQDCL
jgi:hypothetical protein